MIIGVISDTHLTYTSEYFNRRMRELFGKVDLLIHAGDITGIEVYKFLSDNWDIRAVRGNMDDSELYNVLPEKRIENVMGKKIGVIHGKGSPYGIENRVLPEFNDVDLIIFGHSHIPLNKTMNGVVLFNPGSYGKSRSGHGSVGMIEIGDAIACRHVTTDWKHFE